MSRHTPGPWKAHQCGRYWKVKREDISGYTVAEVGPIEGVAESNACLIAAAPELLAACMELAGGDSTRGPEMARAAIAKATGGAA